jgi:hypothetical protein
MRYIQKKMTRAEFWEIKKEIDKEVERVGWSKEKCIAYISNRYHARSRLAMTDDQLIRFKAYLVSLPDKQAVKPSSKKLLRNRLTIRL